MTGSHLTPVLKIVELRTDMEIWIALMVTVHKSAVPVADLFGRQVA